MRLWLLILILISWNSLAAVTGQIKSISDYYPQTLYEPVDDLVPVLQGTLQGKAKWSRSLRVQWKLLTYGNLVSNGESALSSPQNEQFYADLPEAFVEKKIRNHKFRLGSNTLNWGVVDIYSPMDVTNAGALFHPLRTLKRGAPMVQWNGNWEWLNVDAVYIPWQQPALFPDSDSRWLPRDVLLNVASEDTRISLPSRLEYQFKKPVNAKGDPYGNAQRHNGGMKLTGHFGNLDVHAMYFDGLTTSPKAKPTITIDLANEIAESPIVIAPLYYRVATSGLGFVWAGEKWIFKNENVYQHGYSSDPLVPKWNWQHVLGAETNWEIGTGTLTTIFQYYYSPNPQKSDNLSSSYFRLFDRTPVFAMRYAPSDDWTFLSSILYESKTQGTFALLGFENKWTDSLQWGLSWRDFSARRDGLLKTFDRNDHATLELTYFF